jgi:hypothetical protein|tara:strand:+ start:295 stop:1089 length:795 start_codon:yes stop_codon:yes gene_type:complete
VVTKTAAASLRFTEHIVLADATSGAFSLTLPPATDSRGFVFYIKKTDSSTNAVTIDGNGSETIDGVATKALSVQYESATIVSDGSNWVSFAITPHAASHEGSSTDVLNPKNLGVVHPLSVTYSGNPTGTAGVDNTAQTVRTITVPANALTQAGDGLRVRAYWTGTTGSAITGSMTVNGVTVAAATDSGGSDFFTNEAWLHYVDSTHATVIETGSYPATGTNSAANVAGFDWTSAQDIDLDQDAVVNNHIVVYFLAAYVFPLGIV